MKDRLIAFSALPKQIQAAINSRPVDKYGELCRRYLSSWLFILETNHLLTPEIKTILAAYCLSAADEKQL